MENIEISVISISNKVTDVCCYHSLLPTFIIEGIGKFQLEFSENIKMLFFFSFKFMNLLNSIYKFLVGWGWGVQEPQVKKW